MTLYDFLILNVAPDDLPRALLLLTYLLITIQSSELSAQLFCVDENILINLFLRFDKPERRDVGRKVC